MRVLWLSPWLRPLARVHADALRSAGHEVRIVTSDQHPESGPARPDEWVLDPRPKQPSTYRPFLRVRSEVAAFGAEVVVTELVRDPRWLTLGRGLPRIDVVHDDRPHDAAEQRPRWERAVFDRWQSRSDLTIFFSRFVADAVGREPRVVVPLSSDVADAAVPPFVEADGRRDFVLSGRLNDYKNIPVALAAWRLHRSGPHHRGDRLVLIGDGDVPHDLPEGVRWQRGPFRYADELTTLARAKGSLVHYRRATQSGVQMLAMQLGVMPVVSPEGALPELQPSGGPVVGVDDPRGLADALDTLADPHEAVRAGRVARRAYLDRHAQSRVAAALSDAVAQAAAGRRGRSTAR
ncbi:glycosyltransferase family 4 protein [Aeromicrobium wangtongii]|uniref:Glycosyltransferase family 4 protein n=1 Tax=Aeromicrobium wangtongii TaxID=2969247 RepID=A0ABY5M6B6_9ACTN|nr:glycosyltransferase family 4 protein [Aeromicrobium wangtongii]MCD9198972.1 glycosyltransferase family 4 protein [Aeromicrobium wangtongii]UUP12992.1 glycosyltransferase family 4 protein [Aeromicrobium wangtongii]